MEAPPLRVHTKLCVVKTSLVHVICVRTLYVLVWAVDSVPVDSQHVFGKVSKVILIIDIERGDCVESSMATRHRC